MVNILTVEECTTIREAILAISKAAPSRLAHDAACVVQQSYSNILFKSYFIVAAAA